MPNPSQMIFYTRIALCGVSSSINKGKNTYDIHNDFATCYAIIPETKSC